MSGLLYLPFVASSLVALHVFGVTIGEFFRPGSPDDDVALDDATLELDARYRLADVHADQPWWHVG